MAAPDIKGDGLEEAFKKIENKVPKPLDPMEQPEQFVRDVHKQWRSEGGRAAGKPRHSDRFLDDKLKQAKTPIRSLTPKLTGKTRIKPRDGATLIRYFLTNWPETGPDEDGTVIYKPLLSEKEIRAVAEAIEEYINDAEDVTPSEQQPGEVVSVLPGEDIEATLTQFYEESDAYIQVSPEQTLITPQPRTALIGFRNLMNKLWMIEKRGKKKRPIIWIQDIGDRTFDDYENRAKYLNVQSLITRLKAMHFFEERDSDERWQWLQSRAVIVLQDSRREAGADLKLQRRPSFVAHNISFAAVAPLWLASPTFRALYGRDLERVQERSFAVFYNGAAEWQSDSEWDPDDLRYIGLATFAALPNPVGRGLELEPLGLRYAEGLRTVYSAAMHKLGVPLAASSRPLVKGEEAIQQLRYLGYFVLRLDEFLASY